MSHALQPRTQPRQSAEGRINSNSPFVSSIATASVEARRLAHRKFEFRAAIGRETLLNEGGQILRFGISLAVTTVGQELRRMGYARLSARPRHYAQDRDALEAFKKTSPHA